MALFPHSHHIGFREHEVHLCKRPNASSASTFSETSSRHRQYSRQSVRTKEEEPSHLRAHMPLVRRGVEEIIFSCGGELFCGPGGNIILGDEEDHAIILWGGASLYYLQILGSEVKLWDSTDCRSLCGAVCAGYYKN